MFEYKVIEHKSSFKIGENAKVLEDDMNKLAQEGWEFVTFVGGDIELAKSIWRKKK